MVDKRMYRREQEVCFGMVDRDRRGLVMYTYTVDTSVKV